MARSNFVQSDPAIHAGVNHRFDSRFGESIPAVKR